MKPKYGFLISALVAASSPPVLAQSPSEADEILVIGRQFHAVKVRAKIKTIDCVKTLVFRITQSTGDPEIDSVVLQAATECAQQNSLPTDKVSRAEFNRIMNVCTHQRMNELAYELLERRNRAGE